jgi:hypothetical protein
MNEYTLSIVINVNMYCHEIEYNNDQVQYSLHIDFMIQSSLSQIIYTRVSRLID